MKTSYDIFVFGFTRDCFSQYLDDSKSINHAGLIFNFEHDYFELFNNLQFNLFNMRFGKLQVHAKNARLSPEPELCRQSLLQKSLADQPHWVHTLSLYLTIFIETQSDKESRNEIPLVHSLDRVLGDHCNQLRNQELYHLKSSLHYAFLSRNFVFWLFHICDQAIGALDNCLDCGIKSLFSDHSLLLVNPVA